MFDSEFPFTPGIERALYQKIMELSFSKSSYVPETTFYYGKEYHLKKHNKYNNKFPDNGHCIITLLEEIICCSILNYGIINSFSTTKI